MNSQQSGLSSAFIAAIVSLAFLILCGVLGAALGLSNVSSGKTLAIGAGVFGFLVIAVSFFLGGWIASVLSRPVTKLAGALMGVASWALACVGLTFFISSSAISSLTPVLGQAGLGVGGASVTLEQLSRMNVRIVTDMKLLKGKAVSELQVGPPQGNMAAQSAKEIKKEAKGVAKRQDLAGTAQDVQKVSAWASWIAFGALLVGAVAAILGGLAGRRSVSYAATP